MLQKIRTKTAGIVFKILFGLLIASFALFGVADMFRTDDNATVVAKIDGFKVTKGQLNQDLSNQAQMFSNMFGQNFSVEKLKAMGFEQSLLQSKLDEASLERFADEFKLGVGESQIRDAILKRREFLDQSGRFSPDLYKARVGRGGSEAGLIKRVRHDIVKDITLNSLVPPPVSATLINSTNAFKNEKRVAKYVKITHAAQAVAAPSEAQIKAYYDENHHKFMAPEYRSFQVMKLSPTETAAKMTLTDDVLKAEYEKRIADYTRPEKRDAIEFVVNDAELGKKVKAAVQQGKAADKIVEEFGADKVSKREWGLVKADDIPDEIHDSVLALELNAVSDPLQSKEGYHVVHIKKVEHGGIDSFETVKESLAKKMKIERATDEVIEKTNVIDDEINEGKTLAEIAEAHGLTVQKIGLVDIKGMAKNGDQTTAVFTDNEVLQTVFANPKDEVSPIQENRKGDYFSISIGEVIPTAVKPLEVVKAEATKLWTEVEQKKASKKAATTMLAEVKKGAKLAELGAALNVTTTPAFKRSGDGLKNAFPIGLVKSLFKGDKGAADMGLQGDAYIVAQVDNITPAPALEATDREALVKSLETEQKSDLSDSFMVALKKRYNAKIYHTTEKSEADEEDEG